MGKVFKNLLKEDKRMMHHFNNTVCFKNPNSKLDADYKGYLYDTFESLRRKGKIGLRRCSARSYVYPTR